MPGSFPQSFQLSALVGCFKVVCSFVLAMYSQTAWGQTEATQSHGRSAGTSFAEDIQPLLGKYCLRCHQLENQESGVRVDQLSAKILEEQLSLLKGIQHQIEQAEMPPADEPQPSAEESAQLLGWISESTIAVRTRNKERHGTVRRLTVSQYRNTLRDLLGLDEDLTSVLPPDAISKEGFSNNAQSMILSPLQVESYLDIAIQALELCIVDELAPPVVQTFRMEFGKGINDTPCPDSLILGANSALLNNADFVVTQPERDKPFAFTPFAMRTRYDFIEGYQGNDTVRGWRKFDSIYHSVFACVRGTPGYPKGEAYEVIDEGLLLRPAIPSAEIFGVENTYGPKANFKISLRELPNSGNFRVRVRARRYDDALLLDSGSHSDDAYSAVRQPAADAMFVELGSSGSSKSRGTGAVTVARSGVYRVDLHLSAPANSQLFQLQLGDRYFSGKLLSSKPVRVDPDAAGASSEEIQATPFMVVRLEEGEFAVAARAGDNTSLLGVRLSRLAESHPLAKEFIRFETRTPTLGVHLGLRRDCGSTLTQVADLQRVAPEGWQEYIFEGAINNFPSPIVEANNVNYLAGIREIGVRSEYTDGRDMPRLLIRSVEFEGPVFNEWPPATHRNIFIDSLEKEEPEAYAAAILESFAEKAFRRPVTDGELDRLMQVWRVSYREQADFVQSIKDALSVVLTSPQFLFIVENSQGPQAEDLDEFELAAKLSYFLWNSPPDQRLLNLATAGKLRQTLNDEVDRMIGDRRFSRFVEQFASEWLSLDKFDVVSLDRERFPDLTREVKSQLRQEPARFLEHLFRENLSVRNLVQSDFVMANEVVASYYGLADATDQGFEFIPVPHPGEQQSGGVLTQAAILAGLSNGRESNPIKRGAWLARKIIAEPPSDPPPNVPMLEEDPSSELTLRQQLEAHRSQKGCVKCHEGIDPWGIPFEAFDAAGLFHSVLDAETTSQLPDSDELAGVIVPGIEVKNFDELQAYLATERLDQVAFSLIKHLATYATGRTPSYNEIVFLQEKGLELKASGYRTRDMLHFIINSDLFLKK